MRLWRSFVRLLRWRQVSVLAIAALCLSLNWLTYVYSVSSNQVVEGSLGYFINPLVSVALGVVFLKERLTRGQWSAVGIAALGVVVIAVASGALPWIGLVLALSFGSYGLLKKVVNYPTIESLTIETGAMAPLAIVILVVLQGGASAVFAGPDPHLTLLLMATGPITAIPLLLFGAAANRIPLSILGLMQYMTPIAIFLAGVFVFGEPMTSGRWIGFAIIWVALIVFSVDAYRLARRQRRLTLLEVAEPT